MAVLFALSFAVQFNDPSPLAWILIYGFAAVAALLGAIKQYAYAQILGGMVLLVGVVAQIPYLRARAWQTPFTDLTEKWRMTSETIVDGREFYALFWIVSWMVVVVISSRRALKRPTRSTTA